MNVSMIRTAEQVLHAAMQRGTQTAAGLAYALESAQLLQSPETAAELTRLRSGPVLETEQAALLAEMIGDVQPARVSVLLSLGESVRDQRAHDHSSQREDWYCTNLVAFMGERMGPVLRRLLNAEAKAAQLAARVAELESERHVTNEALSDAAEALRAGRDRIAELEAERTSPAPMLYRDRFGDTWQADGDTLTLAATEAGGPVTGRPWTEPAADVAKDFGPLAAVRAVEDPHDSPLHHTYTTGRDLPEYPHA